MTDNNKKEYLTDNKQIKKLAEDVIKEFQNCKEIKVEEKEDGSITFTAVGNKENDNNRN